MRLVRFNDAESNLTIELHPLLTVVRGLSDASLGSLRKTLGGLASGQVSGGTGSLEIHGVFMDLDETSLNMLELDYDLDVVLSSHDLPGAGSAPDSAQPQQSTGAAAPGLGRTGASNPQSHHRDGLAGLESRYNEMVAEVQQLRSELERIQRDQEDTEQALETSRGGLDGYAVASLTVAREELLDLESRSEKSDVVDTDTRKAELEALLGQLIERSGELRRQLKRLRKIDPEPVRRAYSELQRANRGGVVDVEATEALIEKLLTLDERKQALAAADATHAAMLQNHQEARDLAFAEYTRAEQALRAPSLDSKTVEKLENVHDKIFELSGRSSKFGASKQRRKIEGYQAEEKKLLAELGFETWSSYVMGISSGSEAAEREHQFQVASAAFSAAEADLQRVAQRAPEVHDDAEALEAEYQECLTAATRLLGTDPGDNPTESLRAYLEENSGQLGGMSVHDASLALRHALEATGTELPPHVTSPGELETIGSGWLEAMAALPKKIEEAHTEREQIEAEITARKQELDSIEAGTLSTPQPGDAPELAATRQRVLEAESRARTHEESLSLISSYEAQLKGLAIDREAIEQRLATMTDSIADVSSQRDEALRLVAPGHVGVETPLGDSSTTELSSSGAVPRSEPGPVGPTGLSKSQTFDPEALEWYVLARLAQQRSVSFVGSVPMLIDNAFMGWEIGDLEPVLERLARMSDVIQIIFVTEDEHIVEWGRRLGNDRASVLEVAATTDR